jgi:hypothetical protein
MALASVRIILLMKCIENGTFMRRIFLSAIVALLTLPRVTLSQSSSKDPAIAELQRQLQEMRSQMEKMQNRITELEAPKESPATKPLPDSILPQSQIRPAQAIHPQGDEKSPNGRTSLNYKGITLTPGGFLESTILVRTRNENADMANSYTTIPLNGSSNAELSEFRGTVRNSELSLLIQGSLGKTDLKGYVETDFLGAAPTANYLESSSWTPRLRQLWVQFDRPSGWTITVGQMWSLLTTNSQGIANLAELRPVGEDGNYVVGFTWTREKAIRVTRNYHNKIWAAIAIEDPESTYSAAFVPANVMGLNTSPNAATGVNLLPFLANYSNGQATTLAPDLLAKVAFEPGWGHFEIKAVGRFFRDRIASTAIIKGHTNITEGYGVGFGALMPFSNKKLELSVEGLLGQGIGRYGSSGLPDVTLNPTTGAMSPLRQAWIMGGIVYHHTRRLDLYAYSGNEYIARYAFVSLTGTAAGYGSPLVDYTNCTNDLALGDCNGANRNIYEGTIGYWYRLYGGEHGRIEQGNQILYMHRNLWSGLGRAPQGGDIVAYSTLRFYLP